MIKVLNLRKFENKHKIIEEPHFMANNGLDPLGMNYVEFSLLLQLPLDWKNYIHKKFLTLEHPDTGGMRLCLVRQYRTMYKNRPRWGNIARPG